MYHKTVEDLVLTSTTEPKHSPPISIGSDNSAMFEVWLKSASGLTTNGVTATLEGSNDMLNWSDAIASPMATTGTSAPAYANNDNTTVIPYSQIRLKFEMTGSSPKALVDAAIRTFTTSA